MVTIDDILDTCCKGDPVPTLNDRIEIIRKLEVHQDIINYITNIVSNVNINICGRYIGSLMELMNKGDLEGWCWQTTESAILFFQDTDIIQRGNLKNGSYRTYFHSWILFNYENKEYIFDPCLDIICESKDYYKIFEVEIKGSCLARDVKKEFIEKYNNPKKVEYSYEISEATKKFMEEFFGGLTKDDESVLITGGDNINETMFRNNSRYKAVIEKDKVKKIDVHYYLNG